MSLSQTSSVNMVHLLKVPEILHALGIAEKDWGILFYFEYNVKSRKLLLDGKIIGQCR